MKTTCRSRMVRNPRYAPEFLERKLSPSALVTNLATVAVVSSFSTNPLPPLPPLLPLPPIPVGLPIPEPVGPVGPA